jgi:hypothetical protein
MQCCCDNLKEADAYRDLARQNLLLVEVVEALAAVVVERLGVTGHCQRHRESAWRVVLHFVWPHHVHQPRQPQVAHTVGAQVQLAQVQPRWVCVRVSHEMYGRRAGWVCVCDG